MKAYLAKQRLYGKLMELEHALGSSFSVSRGAERAAAQWPHRGFQRSHRGFQRSSPRGAQRAQGAAADAHLACIREPTSAAASDGKGPSTDTLLAHSLLPLGTMAHKQLTSQAAAREKVLRGATTLFEAVRVTLEPKSKSVLIEKKWGTPIVSNDGVTIALLDGKVVRVTERVAHALTGEVEVAQPMLAAR